MENVRSKRRPVKQQDDVDIALEKMNHRWKYNPFRQLWWRYVVLFAVIFGITSYLAPAWNASGAGGVANQLVQIAIQLAISAMIAVFFIYIQFFAIARPRAYWLKPYETGVTFNDYRGNPQVLEMAREVVMLLKGSKDFKNMGGEVIRGLMLEGDPGVGKSYLAQAIATEAGVPFGYCSAPSLQSPFLAGGMLAIRGLYKKARKLAQQHGACILFLDEIDAIGQKRNGGGGGGMGMGAGGMFGGGGSMLINELLVQLDPPPVDERAKTKFLRWLGLEVRKKRADRPAVLTIAATNLVEQLDEALLRPGRFDRKITVDKPDADGRHEIIEYYLDKVNHENIPVDRFVSETVGYSPVAIRYVINEAVVRAHFNGRDVINYRDVIEARDLHEVGLRQPIRNMSREEKRRLAYHETGHAVAQVLLVPWERIVKLTIIRHGSAYGFMQPKPLEEKHIYLKEELEVDIQVSLASRASEELFLGSGSNGFFGDLNNATAKAVHIIGDIGLNGHLYSRQVLGIPGASMQMEVEMYLEDQMKKVRSLLQANSDMVHALAAELLERDELLGDEVLEIINQFPIKLTNDARQKRKRIGFHPHDDDHETGTGVWTEVQPLAATGTDDAMPHPPATAAFRIVKDIQGAPDQGLQMPQQRVDAPATPRGVYSYNAPEIGGMNFNPASSIPPYNGPVEAPAVDRLSTPPVQAQVQVPLPASQPQQRQPATRSAQDQEDDDLLPKGW